MVNINIHIGSRNPIANTSVKLTNPRKYIIWLGSLCNEQTVETALNHEIIHCAICGLGGAFFIDACRRFDNLFTFIDDVDYDGSPKIKVLTHVSRETRVT